MIAAQIERLTEREGAEISSADGTGDGTSAEAKLMRAMVNAFAEYERALIRARTSAALRRKVAKGEAAGGEAPYGYQIVAGRLVPEDREQEGLARIRELREEGLSLRKIVRELQGKYHPRGRRWYLSSVARIVGSLGLARSRS
jgi:DNA invertase Pin-like site-specific DNA recombinase